MNSEDLSLWIAYDKLDGIPDHTMLAGIITSNLFNARSPARRQRLMILLIDASRSASSPAKWA